MDDDQKALEPPTVLEPPKPVTTVTPDSAASAVKLDAERTAALDRDVARAVDDLVARDVHDPAFEQRVKALTNLGGNDIAQSAQASNRMLERPTSALGGGLFNEKSKVSKTLLDLRRTIETLSPARQGDMFSPKKVLGILPFGNKLVDYFRRYESSQAQLDAIIKNLYQSKDELLRDNASIEQEKTQMWSLMQRLEQHAYLLKKFDEELAAKLDTLDATDPERARTLREDVLFYTRQRRQDVLTQMAVNVQGYMALDLIKKNNVELVKGVDRATTTTVAALRTAIVVAQALANQKLVLNQITALNTTTSSMIEATSTMLRQQSVRTHELSAGATVDVGSLQRAFDNVFATLDEMSAYRVKALDSMQQTVTALSGQVDRAKDRLAREERPVLGAAGATAPLGLEP